MIKKIMIALLVVATLFLMTCEEKDPIYEGEIPTYMSDVRSR